MSDLERLKELDPQEVYKKTFITPKVLHNLLEGNFDRLGNRTKALGFVSILERELGLDLHELRQRIDEYFGVQQQDQVFEIKEKEQKSGSSLWLVVLALLLVAAGGGYYYLASKKEKKQPDSFISVASEQNESGEKVEEEVHSVTSSSLASQSSSESLQIVQSEAKSQESEANESEPVEMVIEANVTEENLSQEQMEEEAIPTTLTIVPKKKLWVGIIYLDNYKKKNYVTSSPIEINTSRDQLIVTGHGLFRIEQNGEISESNSTAKQRFIYRAGMLEKIDAQTFRHYNRGRDW